MKLEQFRIKKKLTHKKLAESIGISGKSPESTVQRWCMGKRIPEKKFMNKNSVKKIWTMCSGLQGSLGAKIQILKHTPPLHCELLLATTSYCWLLLRNLLLASAS